MRGRTRSLRKTGLRSRVRSRVAPANWSAPRSGRRVRLEPEESGDLLTVSAPDGKVELVIRLTDEGPTVQLQAAALELFAPRDITLECGGRFRVRAREGIAIETAGPMQQRVAGALEVEVGGRSQLRARAVSVEATLGNVDVRANDDVALEGERILLNR